MSNSIGHLTLAQDEIVFAARRRFQDRVHRIKLSDVASAEWKRGFLMNRLILRTSSGERAFYVFKDVHVA